MRIDTLKSDLLNRRFLNETKWIVFTGAPCSGKTTTLTKFEKLGFSCLPEVARVYIESELNAGKSIEEIRRNESSFQQAVIEAKLKVENEISPDQVMLLDRGIPDSITYFRVSGIDPNLALPHCFNFKYALVLLLDPLPLVSDNARIEDENTVKFIDLWLEKDYKSLGYKVTRVPIMSVESRVDFILDRIKAMEAF